LLFFLLFVALGMPVKSAEEFGRFFTTAGQRARLDALRQAEPAPVAASRDEAFGREIEEAATAGSITVRGVVYRHNGASTAWVNDSNSYEGDIASQTIQVNRDNIRPDAVEMYITGNQSAISLKVGQTYEPVQDRITDVTHVNAQQDD
jgi:hypothetical protein